MVGILGKMIARSERIVDYRDTRRGLSFLTSMLAALARASR